MACWKQTVGSSRSRFPFAGQTIPLTRDARGQIQRDFRGPVDPMALAEMADFLPTPGLFPKHPLTIGQSWQPDTIAMRADPFTKICDCGREGVLPH
jgi:hypothetical protein